MMQVLLVLGVVAVTLFGLWRALALVFGLIDSWRRYER
jgi:hypothetical protein